ncbi:MAG: hypothetical protein GOU97_04760 [Nanoarchaeota archaeon]|nr:hypothetical protein [Nanoarchaeota archaeon]
MLHPQEVIVWYLIPAVRRELAKTWTKKMNLSNKKAAELLRVTQAAVSQYSKSKRASKVKFPEKIIKEIEKSAEKIIKDPSFLVLEIQRIIELSRKTRFICKVHEELGVPCNKEVCY